MCRPRLLLIVVPSLLTLAALLVTVRQGHSHSVFALTNYLGTIAHSVAIDHSLAFALSGRPFKGPVVFHSLRMPLPPVFLAGCYDVVGDRLWAVYLLKVVIFATPLVVSMALAYRAAWNKWTAATLLILPFVIPNFLLQVVTMQTEEGFYYGLLALAVSILLFKKQWTAAWTGVFGLTLVSLYLCKSSLRFACVVLLLLSFARVIGWGRRLALTGLLALTMISWGCYQKSMSGRFTLGSSLDGLNLHKGNYAEFLNRYPPADNGYIDRWDDTLSPPYAFSDEWSFSDYHTRVAKAFILSRPWLVLKADAVKLWIFWFSLRDIGAAHPHDIFGRLDPFNMALTRLLMWAAVGAALYNLWKRRFIYASLGLLAVFVAVSIPYIVGFALIRHASVLIFPSALFLLGNNFYAPVAGLDGAAAMANSIGAPLTVE